MLRRILLTFSVFIVLSLGIQILAPNGLDLPLPFHLALAGYFCKPIWQTKLGEARSIYACGGELVSVYPGEFAGFELEDAEELAKQCLADVNGQIDDPICENLRLYFLQPEESVPSAARTRFQEIAAIFEKDS